MTSFQLQALAGTAIFTLIGLFFGLALALAAVKFRVETDPRIDAVKNSLPGANCGACGFAGCESYAEAVVTRPEVPPDRCRPGGAAVAGLVASLTSKQAGEAGEMTAVLRCGAPAGGARSKFLYRGWETCAAASGSFGGPNPCPYGCVGLGDCARACPFGALTMSLAGGPVIDRDICTGCGLCAAACPKSLLELVPRDATVVVACLNPEKGAFVKSVCDVGCISCRLCVKKGPEGLFKEVGDLIEVDYARCREAPMEEIFKAAAACKPGAIKPLADDVGPEVKLKDAA